MLCTTRYIVNAPSVHPTALCYALVFSVLNTSLMAQEVPPLPQHDAPVLDVKFPKDGSVLTASGAVIRRFELPLAQQLHSSEDLGAVVSEMALGYPQKNKDGVVSAATYDGRIKILSMNELKTIREMAGEAKFYTCCDVDIDGSVTAAGSETSVDVWNVSQGKMVCRVADFQRQVNCVRFVPGSENVVCASSDGTCKLIEYRGCKSTVLVKLEVEVASVAVSPNGKFIAIGASDGTIHYWSNGRISAESTKVQGIPTRMRFSADGSRIVACGANQGTGFMAIVNVASSGVDFEVRIPRDPIRCVDIAPGGGTIAVGSVGRRASLLSQNFCFLGAVQNAHEQNK